MRTRHRTNHPGIYYRLKDETDPDGPRRYVVYYVDGTGKQRNITLPPSSSLRQAKDKRASLMSRRVQGDMLIPTNLRVGEVLDDWLEARRSSLKPTTVEAYEWGISHIKEHFGRRKIVDLSPSDVARMIADLKATGMKTWSVKKILTPLNSALRLAVRDGYLHSNPIDKLLSNERPKADQKEMRCLNPDEIPRLLNASLSERWKTLFATLVFTGLRISEALSLTWQDIDFKNGLIHVRQGKTENARRSVMLMDALSGVLRAWKLQQTPGHQFVFANATGGLQGRTGALAALRHAEKRAGLPDYTLHELRHTFVSILISLGENPVFIARQVGHASPAMTLERYAHLFDREASIERAREKLETAYGQALGN